MTRTKQNKTIATDAVELNEAALDQAAGGSDHRDGPVIVQHHGSGLVRTITGGTTKSGT